MCDKKILTPWPGHVESCNGLSHSYLKERGSVLFPGQKGMFRITPEMLGENLPGTFHAPCPTPLPPPPFTGQQRPPWEEYQENDAKERRRLVDSYFYYRDQTFANYDAEFSGHQEDVKEIRRFMRADHLKRLILKGEVGRGKSHLAQACRNQHRIGAVMISTSNLYRLFRETDGFEPDDIALAAMKRVNAASLIVLDDLGVERQTDCQVFNQGLKDLLESFTGKLIVTTNLAELDMANIYGQKIVSRLYEDAIVIVLSGKDFRRRG